MNMEIGHQVGRDMVSQEAEVGTEQNGWQCTDDFFLKEQFSVLI